MAKKRGFFKNYYNVIRLSRWVSLIRVVIVIVFLLANLIFEWTVIHANLYFTVSLASYLIENAVFALASVPEEIFDKNKKRHLLLASIPVNIWLITFVMFWPIVIGLINVSVGILLKIIIAFVSAKLIVNSAVGMSERYKSKIVGVEE